MKDLLTAAAARNNFTKEQINLLSIVVPVAIVVLYISIIFFIAQ